MVYESLASKKTKNKAVLKLLLPMLQQPQEGTPCLPTASALAFAREMICMEQGGCLKACFWSVSSCHALDCEFLPQPCLARLECFVALTA